MKIFHNLKGQSLLELTIMLGVALVIVAGVTFATLNGLKNSQFSQNQVQATKFAQEGIDAVRVIRDRDYAICTQTDTTLPTRWSEVWAAGYGANGYSFGAVVASPSCISQNKCNFVLQSNSTPYCSLSVGNQPFWLRLRATPEILGIFQRQIYLEDDAASRKKVTAKVSWSDSTGTHQSVLVSTLANF